MAVSCEHMLLTPGSVPGERRDLWLWLLTIHVEFGAPCVMRRVGGNVPIIHKPAIICMGTGSQGVRRDSLEHSSL